MSFRSCSASAFVTALAVAGALIVLGSRAVQRVDAEPHSEAPRSERQIALTYGSNTGSARGTKEAAALLSARTESWPVVDPLAVYGAIAMVAFLLAVRSSRSAADSATRQSEFVAALTHEMKTPLSLIMLTSDSLAQGRYTSTAMVRDYGRIISAEGRQLSRLVENVLCYARFIDASACYSIELVDLIELVGESISRFSIQIEDTGCDVYLDLPHAAPPVVGDRGLLRAVLDNLVENALKHGGAGRYLLITGRADDRFVHLEMTDRGEGIPPEDLPRVFDKFYRGRGSRTRGSGLGLTIANRVIVDHGGKIAIRSVVGQGTTVEMHIPVRRVH